MEPLTIKNRLTDIELKNIKDECEWQANNCGGCETCLRAFGTKEKPYDYYQTWLLIKMIEDQREEIAKLILKEGK